MPRAGNLNESEEDFVTLMPSGVSLLLSEVPGAWFCPGEAVIAVAHRRRVPLSRFGLLARLKEFFLLFFFELFNALNETLLFFFRLLFTDSRGRDGLGPHHAEHTSHPTKKITETNT